MKLLPCPFCGEKRVVITEQGSVCCYTCGARMVNGGAQAWNTRALPADGDAMDVIHTSDCSIFNMPAYPNGPCDCGAIAPTPATPTQEKE